MTFSSSTPSSFFFRRRSRFSSAFRFFFISRRRFSIVFWFLAIDTFPLDRLVHPVDDERWLDAATQCRLTAESVGTANRRKSPRWLTPPQAGQFNLVASAAPATATATAVTAAATAAAAAATRFAGSGLVDRQGSAIVLLLVEAIDGRLRLGVARHLDETKTSASAGIPVRNDLGAFDRTEFRKNLFQIRARNVIAQIPNIQFPSHFESPVRGRRARSLTFRTR